MSQFKWYKRDTGSALDGMRMLTLEEKGAFNTIIDLIYHTSNRLYDDDRFICGWLGCDVRVWKRIKSRLVSLGKIQLEGGLITNVRASSELTNAQLSRSNTPKSDTQSKKNNELTSTDIDRDIDRDIFSESKDSSNILPTLNARDDCKNQAKEIYNWLEEFFQSPRPYILAPILPWLEAGADFELDIKPAAERFLKRKGSPPGSLNWLDDDISRSIAQRKKPLAEAKEFDRKPSRITSFDMNEVLEEMSRNAAATQ